MCSVFFPIFWCCTKNGDQPKKELVKSSYKTNREVKNLKILLHVDQPPNLLIKYGNFKWKKLEIQKSWWFHKCGDLKTKNQTVF